MKNTFRKSALLITSALLLISCQPQTTQSLSTPTFQIAQSGDEVEDVRVVTTEPTEAVVDSETFPLPNCGGTSELGQTLGTHASVGKSVTVGIKAKVVGGGEAEIPAVAKLKLEIEVEAAYQQTFASANARLDTIDMTAAAGTHVVYEIGWYEQTFDSIVAYSSGGKVYEVPYTYKLRIPKIVNSYQIECPSGGAGFDGQPTSQPVIQPTAAQVQTPIVTSQPYDCLTTVSASRPLVPKGTGESCWLQLVDGGPAEIIFNDAAQITYRTSSSGDDIYFYIANIGDRLSDVVGGTIRPSRFVMFGYGGYEQVKNFEIQYHSPGGSWVACLRDANNGFQALNSVCK